MDCPECGAPLVTYRLAGREAPVCEQCGHVGIDAEHRGEMDDIESWSEALRRYYGDADDPTVPVRVGDGNEDRTPPETWDDALRRFNTNASGATSGDDDETGDEREDGDAERTADSRDDETAGRGDSGDDGEDGQEGDE